MKLIFNNIRFNLILIFDFFKYLYIFSKMHNLKYNDDLKNKLANMGSYKSIWNQMGQFGLYRPIAHRWTIWSQWAHIWAHWSRWVHWAQHVVFMMPMGTYGPNGSMGLVPWDLIPLPWWADTRKKQKNMSWKELTCPVLHVLFLYKEVVCPSVRLCLCFNVTVLFS